MGDTKNDYSVLSPTTSIFSQDLLGVAPGKIAIRNRVLVVFVHGLGESVEKYRPYFDDIQSRVADCSYLLCQAQSAPTQRFVVQQDGNNELVALATPSRNMPLWFPIRMRASGTVVNDSDRLKMVNPADIGMASSEIAAYLDEKFSFGENHAVVMIGFSQGACVTADVALRGTAFDMKTAVLVGGFHPVSYETYRKSLPEVQRLPAVVLGHSKHDAIVPFAFALDLQEALRSLGAATQIWEVPEQFGTQTCHNHSFVSFLNTHMEKIVKLISDAHRT